MRSGRWRPSLTHRRASRRSSTRIHLQLIANTAQYGGGRIAIRLEAGPEAGYALSVANDGPALPEGFDPGARGEAPSPIQAS
jgi:hypothetical protein